MMLWIDAGHWCGGLEFDYDPYLFDWECVKAPPIARWMVGKMYGGFIQDYITRKGWRAEWI